MFHEDPLLNPSDRLPSFKLNSDLFRIDRFYQVEIDMPFYCITCEIEWFIELDKC